MNGTARTVETVKLSKWVTHGRIAPTQAQRCMRLCGAGAGFVYAESAAKSLEQINKAKEKK